MAGKYLSVNIHFVWSTAGREPWLAAEWQARLSGYIGQVVTNKKGRLISAGGVADHVHLYASVPSTETLAALVNAMKANSSRWLHETFPHLRAFAWQKGYGAFSVSKSAEGHLLTYIRNQALHHRRHDFKAEFLLLLEKHGIEYDERYLWD